MFAQLMREMLTPSTFESFRVYSLDTVARIREALLLVDDVRRGRIPQATLMPIVEELEWSFDKDLAALALAKDEIVSFKLVVKNKTNFSLDDFTSHLRLIAKLIDSEYKTTLETRLVDAITARNRAIELRKLTGFYCSHLINAGYMRGYVLSCVNEYFFVNTVRRMGVSTVSKFFREFDCKNRKFTVHAPVSTELAKYLSSLDYSVRRLSSLPAPQRRILTTNPNIANTPMVLELTTDQLDPHGAANFAHQTLTSHRAISFLDPFGMDCEWGETMHVVKLRAAQGVSVGREEFMLKAPYRTSPRSSSRLKSIRNNAKAITTNFNASSAERLLSSINTSALARSSVNPENQLISLWSAIEVLLSDPRDVARIVHYNNLVVPCITLRHIRKQLISACEALMVIYRKRFKTLIWRTAPASSTDYAKAFADLMLLPEHKPLRDDLCTLLAGNPLALHRVWKLNSDYGTPSKVHDAMIDHQNRVSWQIHRIYRARNQLVHSGRTPTYLESIIINAAEYYRSAIATVIRSANQEPGQSDIDQVVAEIGIKHKILLNKFGGRQKDPNITSDDVMLLMNMN